MTVGESVIAWLKGYDESLKIDTDLQSDKVNTYSLVKEPTQTVKAYISGRRELTDYFAIQARRHTQYNPDRISNNAFGESLEAWVHAQNAAGNFPSIDNATVKQVSVTTPWYVGNISPKESVYQMTLAIKYEL